MSQNRDFSIIDLTHTLTDTVPTFDGGCGFRLSIKSDYKDSSGPDVFRTQNVDMGAGVGTHMDAPAHCFPAGKTIDMLNMGELVTDCVVIHVDKESYEGYVIMPEAVERFEREHGKISPNTFVIFYTGWSVYWNEPEKYRNNFKFPSVHESTAKLLLERDIAGLGIDTLSTDTGKAGFPVHRAVLGAGKYLVENIANANLLPVVGAQTLVLPMKIKDGTESPVRMVGLVDF